jgi:hypothetical protein
VLRTLSLLTAFALATVSIQADPTVTSTETIVRFNVQPMKAPTPSLRYTLLPELAEMNPGNPIPNYLKCMLDVDPSTGQEIFGQATLRQADRAARMDKPDWQILLKAKTDGFNLLLPDVQKIRSLATALQMRFREEIAADRLDDALVTAKTMFAMTRHMGEHPTLIGDLVGIAIGNVTIVAFEEMLERPGCPNLFWALTALPNPLVSLENGLRGERVLVYSELKDLDDQAPIKPPQLKKLIAHLDKIRSIASDSGKSEISTRGWIDARINDETKMKAARERLVETGLAADRLATFPADQIVLLDEKREYEVRRDEAMRIMNFPAWQVESQFAALKYPKEPILFDGFVPALIKVRRAQARLEQRIALLRHLEALRMYAAEHNGKLPSSLTDVAVPLPMDPFTGKPFRYNLEGATAHIRGASPPGEEKNPGFNVHYEVTVHN